MPDTRHYIVDDARGAASRQRPVLIGVTGGIGSGKSTVVDQFVRHGAVSFSADEAVHALYATDEVRKAVVDRWGDRVIAVDGTIDRSVIAAIVFPDAVERAWLEGLLHPLVAREWLRFVHDETEAGGTMIVAEVPLLFEANLEERYDVTVLVTAPVDLRTARVGERASGDSQLKQRIAAQLPDGQKASRADYVIENSGDRESLATRVAAIVEALTATLPERS